MLLIRLASLVLGVVLGAGSAKADLERLLEPDPALPSLARVEALGLAFVRPRAASARGHDAALWEADTYLATGQHVDAMHARPIEEVTRLRLYRLAEALAHQWGRARILLDYLERYEAALAAGGDPRDRAGVTFRLLRSLRSASYGVDDDAPDKYQRLAAAVRLAYKREYQRDAVAAGPPRLRSGLLFDGLYAAAARGDVAGSRAEIAEARRALQARIDFVLEYNGALLARAGPGMRRISPEAVRLLEWARRAD